MKKTLRESFVNKAKKGCPFHRLIDDASMGSCSRVERYDRCNSRFCQCMSRKMKKVTVKCVCQVIKVWFHNLYSVLFLFPFCNVLSSGNLDIL